MTTIYILVAWVAVAFILGLLVGAIASWADGEED